MKIGPAMLAFLVTIAGTSNLLSGCVATPQPTTVRQARSISLPPSGELEARAQALSPINNVLPVKVAVKSLAPRARVFKQPGIWGISDTGERIPELSLDDHSITDNAEALLTEVSSGENIASEAKRTHMDASWSLVAIAGPIIWSTLAVQTAITSTKSASSRLADYQLRVFPPGAGPTLVQNVEYSGYAFLPNQHYRAIQLTVLNKLSGNDESITVPLTDAAVEKP